jgi:hypothetical protein
MGYSSEYTYDTHNLIAFVCRSLAKCHSKLILMEITPLNSPTGINTPQRRMRSQALSAYFHRTANTSFFLLAAACYIENQLR